MADNKKPTKIKNPLLKRIPRQLRRDLGRYIVLFLFMTLVTGFVSGYLVADRSMQVTYANGPTAYHLEDGHFATDRPMTDRELAKLEKAQDIAVYRLYFKDKAADNDSTVRLYKLEDRKDNNKICVMEGELPDAADEIAVDRLYLENNDLAVGDTLTIAGRKMTIVGSVALPDYSCLFKRNSDMMFDATHFTFGLVTGASFDAFSKGGINYNYIWYNNDTGLTGTALNDHSEDILDWLSDYFEDVNEKKADDYADAIKERLEGNPMAVLEALDLSPMDPSSPAKAQDRLEAILDDEDEMEDFLDKKAIKDVTDDIEEPVFNYLTDFLQRSDNNAVTFPGDDMGRDLVMIITLFYVLMAVLAFIYGITCRSTIEQEASAIGTLRASGFTRGELLRHYMVLPVLSAVLAALFGNALGYTVFKDYAASLYYGSYSLPTYVTVWNGDAFWLTTVIPFAIMVAVNLLVLSWALRIPPLQFLRGELKTNKKRRVMRLERGSFLRRFGLRVFFQNKGAYLVMFFGLTFATLILIFGVAMLPLLDHFKAQIVESKIADYQYVLKAEEETDTKGAEKFCLGTLIETKNDEEILVYGISENSAYLDIDFSGDADEDAAGPAQKDANGSLPAVRAKGKASAIGTKDNPAPVCMTDNYMKKYGYEEGDILTLEEKYGNKTHTFRVVTSYRYDATLALFLTRADYNKIFGEDKGYFNGYFSDREITDIDDEYIASVIDQDDLTAIADQLNNSFGGMMNSMLVFCIVIYLLLIYLLTKTVVERNAREIGLLKILGYTDREANRLYNTATGVFVVLSLIAAQPLIEGTFALLWSRMMRVMNGYLALYIPPWVTPFLIVCGIACYFALYPILMRRIRKIPPGIVLKGQE